MWGMVLFWDFLLGLLRTWNIDFGVFGGVIGLILTAAAPYRCFACGSGASLSRLGKLYFGRGYRTVLNAENAENAVVKNAISNAFKK